MILIIDNYDSFVYNLADYIQRLGSEVAIFRNNEITLEEIKALNPTAIIISPGPCAPQQAGISIDVIKQLGSTTPILGVCLGHQAIGEAYGGKTVKSDVPVHGRASDIQHNGLDIFMNLHKPLTVGRYHSLIVNLPEDNELEITAVNERGEIMAMRHKTNPVYGVQFHPESVLTPQGLEILNNFLLMAHQWHTEHKA